MSGESYRHEDLQPLKELMLGMRPPQSRIEGLPAPLLPVGRAMYAANGAGTLSALRQLAPQLESLLLAEIDDPGSRSGPAPFPVEALAPVLKQLVVESARSTLTPPEMTALPLLAIAAGCIGNSAYLYIKEAWKVWPPIWLAVIGETGTGKTPAQLNAEKPLEILIDRAEDRYKAQQEQHTLDLAAWEAVPAKARGPKPEPPERERYFAVDSTFEAIKRVLSQSPGLVFLFDELVFWIQGMDAYRSGKGGDRANWLSMWNARRISVDRAGAEYIYQRNPVVAICGGIQPVRLPELADEARQSDGFLDRILMAWPEAEVNHLTADDVSRPTVQAVADSLYAVRHRLDDVGTAAVVMDQSARDVFHAWHYRNVETMRQTFGMLRGVYAKLPDQLLKLVLIQHCLYHPAAPGAVPVTAEEMEDGILLVEYFRAHAHRTLAAIGVSVKAAAGVEQQPAPDAGALLAERVLRVLKRLSAGKEWISQRDIAQAMTITAPQRRTARDLLVERGLLDVRIYQPPGGGKPSEQWRLIAPDGAQ